MNEWRTLYIPGCGSFTINVKAVSVLPCCRMYSEQSLAGFSDSRLSCDVTRIGSDLPNEICRSPLLVTMYGSMWLMVDKPHCSKLGCGPRALDGSAGNNWRGVSGSCLQMTRYWYACWSVVPPDSTLLAYISRPYSPTREMWTRKIATLPTTRYNRFWASAVSSASLLFSLATNRNLHKYHKWQVLSVNPVTMMIGDMRAHKMQQNWNSQHSIP